MNQFPNQTGEGCLYMNGFPHVQPTQKFANFKKIFYIRQNLKHKIMNPTIQLWYNPGEYIPSPMAPEGVPTVIDTATHEDLSSETKQLLERNKQRVKDRNEKEYEEHRRKTDVRFTGEKPLESEDWKFATALTILKAPIGSTMRLMANPTSASTNIGSALLTAGDAAGVAIGVKGMDDLHHKWLSGQFHHSDIPTYLLNTMGTLPAINILKSAPTIKTIKKISNKPTLIEDTFEYINTVDDTLLETQPLTTNMSKQFWRQTSQSKLTDAEKAGIPKGERFRYKTSLGKSKISPEEKAGLPKSIRNNGKYSDLTFFRVSHDVPTVNDDGFAVLTDPANYFLNTTTDGLVHTHGNYPYLKNHVYAIDPEGLRGSTLFSTEPSDMFFDTRTLKIKPKHVTFISGDPDALKQAADAGFKTMSSPKLKLLFKQSRASYPYVPGKRVVLPEDYHQSLRSFVDSYFSRPSMDTYEKISRQTTLPISVKPFTGRNFIKTGKDVNWSPSDFRNVVYNPASPIEYEFKEKIGLNPYVGYFTSIFDKIKLNNAAKNIKPLKHGGQLPFYLKYFKYKK